MTSKHRIKYQDQGMVKYLLDPGVLFYLINLVILYIIYPFTLIGLFL